VSLVFNVAWPKGHKKKTERTKKQRKKKEFICEFLVMHVAENI
jgi:hypothetical protein